MPDNYKVFDELLEGVQVLNEDYEYVYVNKTLVQHAKKEKASDLLNKSMLDEYPGIEQTEMFSNIKKCLETRENIKMINEFHFEDGSVGYFELRMQRIPEGVIILTQDVTETKCYQKKIEALNKHFEQKIQERTQELAEALEREKNLNELKSEFVSFASHEFKTPLGEIQISVNVLENFNTTEENHIPKRTQFHNYIRSSVDDMFNTLNEYLRIEQTKSIKQNREVFDLSELVQFEIEKLHLIMKKKQKVNYLNKGMNVLQADKQILKSIILNLLTNAIKYSDEDVELLTELRDDILKIQVVDKGIGIPESEQEQLFQKFFRATNSKTVNGTGLGLNIVRKYVEMLKGEINFTSALGEGTSFEVKIPVRA